jgi:hypothetical protein
MTTVLDMTIEMPDFSPRGEIYRATSQERCLRDKRRGIESQRRIDAIEEVASLKGNRLRCSRSDRCHEVWRGFFLA